MVVVVVGDGDGDGLGEVDSVGAGVGEGEVVSGFTPPAELTLYATEYEAGDTEEDTGDDKDGESIHYRPQFRRTATTTTTTEGRRMRAETSEKASSEVGAEFRVRDISCTKPCE